MEIKLYSEDQSSSSNISVISPAPPKALNGGDGELHYENDDYSIGYYGSARGLAGVLLNDLQLMRLESRADASAIRLSRRLTGAQCVLNDNVVPESLPPMGGDKRQYPPPIANLEQYMVTFAGVDDPRHPHNWAAFRSAMFSAGAGEFGSEYHVGFEVGALGTSLFVAGFGSGPVIWGPLSEVYGRRIVLIVAFFCYICLTFGAATGKDVQTVLLCRFFSGFTAIAPFVLGPSVAVDLYGHRERSLATSLFSLSLFTGPSFAPVVAAFIVKNPHLNWRWTSYVTGIFSCVTLIMNILFMEETHHGVVLASMAEEIRRSTNNWIIYAAHEQVRLSINEIVTKTLVRPIKMLIREPILLLITFYTSFVYGLLYAFLTLIPYTFGTTYGWSEGVRELPYLSLLIGIAAGAYILTRFDKRYNRILEQTGHPVAEERLPSMMVGGVCFSVGLLWMCWSASYPHKVHWIVPCIGAAITGMGFFLSFLPCLTYLLDCYLIFAASAMSANAIVRSFAAAAFPLFMKPMLDALTIKWAGTLLGGVGVLMTPIPFLFYRYGAFIRRNSRYAIEDN
ncbi:uncharacterized protein KQ657_005200 [Scheffersomyces spartinae]|uniref:Major facilitator superfamily (MFS) profile domain-containing protein n=1 Tax=Scheffersomyces spartinae TaxID=45513 RepID=A0A9P7VAF8_9ASCO|nr:uncharacterized protein KQ657_005200 [Scheffersomyces spartinae]KAG7194001.1 hypothetical protein KQ657_005200 [Scheffersomyces spartinae]